MSMSGFWDFLDDARVFVKQWAYYWVKLNPVYWLIVFYAVSIKAFQALWSGYSSIVSKQGGALVSSYAYISGGDPHGVLAKINYVLPLSETFAMLFLLLPLWAAVISFRIGWWVYNKLPFKAT